ncbi:MAG: restriction endonuclease [Paludibacteraceae bacterium]|nr:restriction endonuclease [Paludibacteraceae bacterium]
MNKWIEYSIQYANQMSYLDDLFKVYPTIPEGIREMDTTKWKNVERAFKSKNNIALIESLLQMDLFPIKDSYVAYLRRDLEAIRRNPQTINRLCGRIYELGITKLYERCSEPKETNRQIGPLFKDWVRSKALGITPVSLNKFVSTTCNAILDASDTQMMDFAREELNYKHDKGLDFVARFNGKYVIGEAKFLTDFGGHQNAQFNDAISTISTQRVKAVKIAILDGVLYIPSNNKMYKAITQTYKNEYIMSALVLRDFLYQIK